MIRTYVSSTYFLTGPPMKGRQFILKTHGGRYTSNQHIIQTVAQKIPRKYRPSSGNVFNESSSARSTKLQPFIGKCAQSEERLSIMHALAMSETRKWLPLFRHASQVSIGNAHMATVRPKCGRERVPSSGKSNATRCIQADRICPTSQQSRVWRA